MLNKSLFACALVVSLCVPASPALSQSAPAPTPAASPAGARNVEAAPPEPRGGGAAPAPAPGQGSPNQASAGKGDPNSKAPQEPGGLFGLSPNGMFLVLMVGVIVLMVVFNSRTRRKQEAKRKELLGGMKKGDRVTTIGGIVGTLIEVRDSDVVVKVDEQNNTRMRFLKSAIAHVGETAGDRDQTKKE